MKPSIFTHLSFACATIAVLFSVVLPFDTMPLVSHLLAGTAGLSAVVYGMIAYLSRDL